MRPIKLGPYSPITASTTGFATALTGAGPFTPTATVCTDTLAHKVTLTSTADLHGITVTLTGTSAIYPYGPPLVETLAGPSANTVTSTRHFATLTSVSVSSTLGANTMNVGWAADSVCMAVPLDQRSPIAASFTVAVTGTLNANVDQILANVYDTTIVDFPWITAAGNIIATTTGAFQPGATAMRVNVGSVTNGATYTVYVSQPVGYVG